MLLPWTPGNRDFHARDCAGRTALMLHHALENSSHLPLPPGPDSCLTQLWPGYSAAKSGINGLAARLCRTLSCRKSAIIGAVSLEGKRPAPNRPGGDRAPPRGTRNAGQCDQHRSRPPGADFRQCKGACLGLFFIASFQAYPSRLSPKEMALRGSSSGSKAGVAAARRQVTAEA
jgi:hypothetical protein